MKFLGILFLYAFIASCGNKTADSPIKKFEAALGEPYVGNLNAQVVEFERYLDKTKFKDYFERVGRGEAAKIWHADGVKIDAAMREKVHRALRVVAVGDSLVAKYLESVDAAGSLSAGDIAGGMLLYANDGNEYFAKRIWVINSAEK